MLIGLAFALLLEPAITTAPAFSDLAVYNGAWTITATKTMAGPGKPDRWSTVAPQTWVITAANRS